MKFSIVVPLYNAEQTLAVCIDSIKNQTYKNFECFLIDDGSSDATIKKCGAKIAGDDRFVLITQKNNGVSAARNIGVKKATGDYIVFVDSDDWVEPNLLEEIEKVADGQIIQYGFFAVYSRGTKRRAHSNGALDIKAGNMAAVWRHALPRKPIRKLRFVDTLGGGEDYLFLNQALSVIGSVKRISQCLYHHTFENEKSIMNNTDLALLEQQIIATKEAQEVFINDRSLKNKLAFKARKAWCQGELIIFTLNLFDENAGCVKKLWRRILKKAVMILLR